MTILGSVSALDADPNSFQASFGLESQPRNGFERASAPMLVSSP